VILDIHKIIYFHQPIFIDELESILKTNEQKEIELNKSVKNINHYTENITNLLEHNKVQLDVLIATLKTNCVSLNENVSILEKYVGWVQKIICFFISNNSE
jgi:hypothetical protein